MDPLMETRRILEKVEGRIKGYYLLSEIRNKGDGDYADLEEKYGKDKVCTGVSLIEAYKLLNKITNIREGSMKQ